MDTIAVGVIVLYLITATAIGSLMARRTTTSTGWAVAGGGMSTVLVAVGIAFGSRALRVRKRAMSMPLLIRPARVADRRSETQAGPTRRSPLCLV